MKRERTTSSHAAGRSILNPQHDRETPAGLSTPIPTQRTDRKSDKYDSVAAFLRDRTFSQWLLLLYPVFIYVVHRRRGLNAVAEIDISSMLQIGLTVVCGLYVVHRWIVSGSILRWILTGTSMVWLVLYGLLAVSSSVWSGMPELTLFRGIQVLVYLVLTADALATLGNVKNLIRFQLCYAVILSLFWQCSLLQYNFSVAGLHSSQVPGAIVGIAFTGWIIAGSQWRATYLFVMVMMLSGSSAATYVSLIVGLGVAVGTSRRNRTEGILLLSLGIILAFAYPERTKEIVFYGKSDSNIQTASGRLPTWQWLIQKQMQERPLLGFGFAYGESQARLYNKGGLRMQHMHSSVMSALVNLGIVGAILLLLYWLSVWRDLLRVNSSLLRSVVLASVAAVCLNSLAIDSVTSPMGFGWIGHLLTMGTAVYAKASSEPVFFGKS